MVAQSQMDCLLDACVHSYIHTYVHKITHPRTNACVPACRQAWLDIHKYMHTNTPTYIRTCKNVTHACMIYCNYVTAVLAQTMWHTHASFTANILTVWPAHLNQKMHQWITCGMEQKVTPLTTNICTCIHKYIDARMLTKVQLRTCKLQTEGLKCSLLTRSSDNSTVHLMRQIWENSSRNLISDSSTSNGI